MLLDEEHLFQVRVPGYEVLEYHNSCEVLAARAEPVVKCQCQSRVYVGCMRECTVCEMHDVPFGYSILLLFITRIQGSTFFESKEILSWGGKVD